MPAKSGNRLIQAKARRAALDAQIVAIEEKAKVRDLEKDRLRKELLINAIFEMAGEDNEVAKFLERFVVQVLKAKKKSVFEGWVPPSPANSGVSAQQKKTRATTADGSKKHSPTIRKPVAAKASDGKLHLLPKAVPSNRIGEATNINPPLLDRMTTPHSVQTDQQMTVWQAKFAMEPKVEVTKQLRKRGGDFNDKVWSGSASEAHLVELQSLVEDAGGTFGIPHLPATDNSPGSVA